MAVQRGASAKLSVAVRPCMSKPTLTSHCACLRGSVTTPGRRQHATLPTQHVPHLRVVDVPRNQQHSPQQPHSTIERGRALQAQAGVAAAAKYTVVTLRLGLSPDSMATVRAAVIAYGLPADHTLLLRDIPDGASAGAARELPLSQLPRGAQVPLRASDDDPLQFTRDTGGLVGAGPQRRGFPVGSILQQGTPYRLVLAAPRPALHNFHPNTPVQAR